MSAYITENERYKIETMLKDGKKPKEIAERIGKHYTTVYREIKRGTVLLRDSHTWLDIPTYCADTAQRVKEERGHNKGIDLKIGNNYEYVKELERLILQERYSPYAALAVIRKNGYHKTNVCTTTLYNYIHSGLFLNLSIKDLPYKKSLQKGEEKRRISYHLFGAKNIEDRPKHIYSRSVYGDWEMDTVVSGKGKGTACLLVLTERKMREEIIRPLADRTALGVVKALNKLEREYGTKRFRSVFRTITCDNGVEFSAYKDIERSISGKKPRTALYFCHPYCSSERGSNENTNKLIRRHVPKGCSISDYSVSDIIRIQEWINNYPRKMFGGLSTNEYKKACGIP